MWNEENRLPALWGTLLKVSYSAGFNNGCNQPFFFPEGGTLLDLTIIRLPCDRCLGMHGAEAS
jgi:hypothetical protein